MKQWKRLLSLVLVVSLIAGMGYVIPAVRADDPATPVLPQAKTWEFTDSEDVSNWEMSAAFSVTDDALVWNCGVGETLTHYNGHSAKLKGLENCASWTDYRVSADITVTRNDDSGHDNKFPMAALLVYGAITVRVRPTATANKYDIQIAGDSAAAVAKYGVTVEGNATDVSTEASFNLAVEVGQGKLTVYIDGAEAMTRDCALTCGTAGVFVYHTSNGHTNKETVSFNNFTIEPVVEEKVEFNGTEVTIPSGSTMTEDKYANGYIEADITLTEGDMANQVATVTKNGGNLYARYAGNSTHELRSRFKVEKTVPAEGAPTYRVTLELIVYCEEDYGNNVPQIFKYVISDFAWGETYRVRLQALGNTVKMLLDGQEVAAVTFAADGAMVDYAGYFAYSAATDFGTAFSNMKIVSVAPNAVTLGTDVSAVATLPAYKQVGKTSFTNQRSHFGAGETVAVTFSDTSAFNMETLRYTTASNTEGVKLTATADSKVFTFVMPEEAVTVVCDKLAAADSEVLYTNDGTEAVTTANWDRASLVNGENGLQFATLANSAVLFYNTAVADGWMQASFVLPTMSAADIAASAQVGTNGQSDMMYSLYMRDNAAKTKSVEADIYYKRSNGTTVMRLNFRNNEYSGKSIELPLENTIWDSSKPVIMKLRTVGNYIEAVLTDATSGSVLASAAFTADKAKDVGNPATRWQFGIYYRSGKLYTDSSKTEEYQINTLAYVKDIEIGRINNTYTVAVDADAAESVSLPAVNEVGTTTPLARDAYEAGEVLKLTLADGVVAAGVKANDEVITDVNAYVVPAENVVITYEEPVASNNTVLYTNDGTVAVTVSDWSAESKVNGENGLQFATIGNSGTPFYKTNILDGWIKATFVLPSLEGAYVGVTGQSDTMYGVRVRDASNGAKSIEADIYYARGTGKTTLRIYARGNDYNAKSISVDLNNSIWNPEKPVILKLRVVGNYVETLLTDATTGDVLANPSFTAAADKDVGNPATQWQFGMYYRSGNLFTSETTQDATTRISTLAYVKDIEIVRIDNTFTVAVDANAAESVSLPAVNELGTTTPLARDAYEAGEVLKLTLAEDVSAADVKANGKVVADVNAYVVPNENVTITYTAPVIVNSTVLYENDGTADITDQNWTAALRVEGTSGIKANTESFYKTEMKNGWISATFRLPTLTSQQLTDMANTSVANGNAGSNAIYSVRMRDADATGVTVQADIVLNRTGPNTSFRLYIAANGYGASAINLHTTNTALNSIWNAEVPVTIKLRKVGNFYEAVLTDGEGNVLAYQAGAADTTKDTKLSDMNNTWQLGVYGTPGNLFTDFADQTGSKLDSQAYITNIQIGRIEKTYTVALDSSAVDKVSLPENKELGANTVVARNAYEAGEKLELTLIDAINLIDVKANGKEIADASAFEVPSKNVTITYEGTYVPVVPPTTDELENESFDIYANGTTASVIFADWRVSTGGNDAKVQNGELVMDKAYNAIINNKYRDGYIEADFRFLEPSDALANTANKDFISACLHVRKTSAASTAQDLRTRFAIKQLEDGTYTATLQLVVYSGNDHKKPNGEAIPIVFYHSIPDFKWGNTYNVKLSAIGNFVQVQLNDVVVMQYIVDLEVGDFAGYFCLEQLANTFTVAVDNLVVDKYDSYGIAYSANMEGILKTVAYTGVKSGKSIGRNAFLAGEFVKLYVSAPTGYAIDDTTLKYTGAVSGDVAITAKDSDTLYGLWMPAENITISANLKEAETATVPVRDTFDTESLMVDRNWSAEMGILQGAARVFGNYSTFLSNVPGSENWRSYTAQTTINVTASTGGTAVAAMVVKSNGGPGYEFGIEAKAGEEKVRVRLYDRINSKMLYYDENATIDLGTDVVLKLVVTGNKLTGYANGVWKFTVDVADITGGVGLMASKINASFDNVIVTDIVAK